MPHNLNPIEKKHFDKIINGLITDGFIDYSNQEPNFFRLGERGFRRIYEEQEEELPFQDIEGNDVLPKVVILTAIKEEYAAVRAHLIELEDFKKDSVVYEVGIFSHNGKKIAKVYIRECGPKNPTAAQETQRALTNFRPDCILFVGIAGSKKPHDFKLGDVIFPEKVHHYEGGKSELDGFKPRPDDVTPTFALYEIAKLERHKNDWKTLIKSKLDFEVSADLGVIASGDKVVEHFDSETGKLISAYYGDSACIEMEGYGFLKAITNQGKEFAVTFGGVVRGVSDILEQELNVRSVNSSADRRPANAKKIASETAAAFAFWLIFKAYK
jgi:nucleoside phosphorylase